MSEETSESVRGVAGGGTAAPVMVCVREDEFRALLEGRDHLRRQVVELQAAASAELDRRRANSLACHVRAFHVAYDIPISDTPHVPPDERIRYRLRLIVEEFFELLEACIGPVPEDTMLRLHQRRELFDCAREDLKTFVDGARLDVDLPELADAMADLDYVIAGSRLEMGIDGAGVARVIHAANMAKLHTCAACATAVLDPDYPCQRCKGMGKVAVKENHKVVKPGGWTPPDIAGELRAQGWAGK